MRARYTSVNYISLKITTPAQVKVQNLERASANYPCCVFLIHLRAAGYVTRRNPLPFNQEDWFSHQRTDYRTKVVNPEKSNHTNLMKGFHNFD